MAIHVIQSQRIEVLLEKMLNSIRQPTLNPLQVLKTQHFIVPSVAVATWLTEKIAEQQGISANTQFHHRIRAFQWAAYQAVLEDKDRVRQANIPRIVMQWRVFYDLQPWIQYEQNPLETEHALYRLIQRIYDSAASLQSDSERQLKKQNMLYWVADKVSRLFSNYMAYRGFCQKGCAGTCQCQSNWLSIWGQQQHLDLKQQIYVPKSFDTEEEKQSALALAAFTQEQAEELEQWQSWLWSHIFHADFENMQEIDRQFWQALGTPENPNSCINKLPQQLVIFTVLDLPPSQLYFMRRLAQYMDIFILHYNPSQEYWADMVDPKWKLRVDARIKDRFVREMEKQNKTVSDDDIAAYIEKYNGHFNADMRESHHPLLTRFGKQARDHFSLLSVLSSGEEGEWVDEFPEQYPQHLLGKIQSDVLNLEVPAAQSYCLDPEDDSIEIHVCHSSLRQLEVLKDRLIAWLGQDDSRQASDILVLSPKLKEQESLIRSVFAAPPSERDLYQKGQQKGQQSQAGLAHQLSQDSVYLPIQIAGISSLDIHNAWRAVTGRITLVQGRFSFEEFSDWLSLAATQQRYALNLNHIERMNALLSEAGFKRGLDAEHLSRSLSAGDQDYRFTLKFALDRLALGVAVPEHCVVNQTLSYADVQPDDFELVFKLVQIYQDFAVRRDWLIQHELGQSETVEFWLKQLMQDVSEFQDAGVDVLASVFGLVQKHDRMLTLASYFDEQSGHDIRHLSLPLDYILQEITAQLETQLEQASPSGAITFSQIGAIRPLPYKLIVMLNLDNGVFPSRDQQLPFDLMQLLKPQLGDRSRLDDDQGAFLDSVLLAQDSVWLFYNGFDVSDGEVRDPSVVVQEFVQHLAFIVKHPEGEVSKNIKVQGVDIPVQLLPIYHLHSLQPFDQQRFAESREIRFKDQWYRVAKQMQQGTTPREAWFCEYPSLPQDVVVLDSTQWIKDVCFPARAYLKAIGVNNLKSDTAALNQEPLILNGLEKYAVRDFLLKYGTQEAKSLLQDTLPVGKTLNATFKTGVQEQQYLRDVLMQYAEQETLTTQQVWKMTPQVHIRIQVPASTTTRWCNVVASRATPQRYAHVWLEYLLWVAYQNTAQQDLERIVVCKDDVIHFAGVNAAQAQDYLAMWMEFWAQAQQYPVLLPAALVLKMNNKKEFEIEWDETDSEQVLNMDSFAKHWQGGAWGGFIDESEKNHPDWAFIFQDSETEPLLIQAFQQHSYRLYQPITQQRQIANQGESA